jgi:hypothetical protein
LGKRVRDWDCGHEGNGGKAAADGKDKSESGFLMYRKALVNGESLYFVHAPPQTALDVRPEQRRPAAPNPTEPKLYASVYYYWWAFLRLNEHYIECCVRGGTGKLSRLYKDFGDVRDGQRKSTDPEAIAGHVDEFREWWIEKGAYLFAEKQTKQNVMTFKKLPKSHDLSGRVFLSVPLAGNLDVTGHHIKSLLRPYFRDYQAENGHYSRARYRPNDNYRLSSLYETLKIANAYQASRKSGKPIKQMALYDDAGLIFEKTLKYGDNEEAIKSKIVSLALKNASRLIANVVRGNFPDYSEPLEGDFVFHKTQPRTRRKRSTNE